MCINHFRMSYNRGDTRLDSDHYYQEAFHSYQNSPPHVYVESLSTAGSSRRHSQASPSLSCSSSFTGFSSLHLGVPREGQGAPFLLSVSSGNLRRVRSFSTSGKGIVNKGDSIMNRSNISLYYHDQG